MKEDLLELIEGYKTRIESIENDVYYGYSDEEYSSVMSEKDTLKDVIESLERILRCNKIWY